VNSSFNVFFFDAYRLTVCVQRYNRTKEIDLSIEETMVNFFTIVKIKNQDFDRIYCIVKNENLNDTYYFRNVVFFNTMLND
jgi:hypothetical protein